LRARGGLELYLTAQRPTDIRLLRWSQIKDGAIHITPSKTEQSSGGKVSIPITPAIDEALQRARNAGIVKGMSYVIHQGNGNAYSRNGIGSAWKRACKRAGVTGISTRQIRPTAATDAIAQGYTLKQLQKTLVHTSSGTTEGYVKQLATPISELRLELPKRGK
jgi:integrase